MRGVVLLGNREVEIRDFPDPEPGPDEVIVRVEAAGICGSDLHVYRSAKGHPDVIAGHETSGVVDRVGHHVENVKEGDRVIVYHAMGCGRCYQCLSGFHVYCVKGPWLLGSNVNGGDADLILARSIGCLKLPDKLSFVDGAIMSCAGGTAYQILKNLQVSGRDALAVFGLGPLGLSAVMIAKALGSMVIGCDPVRERREIARMLGCDHLVDPVQENAVETVRMLTGGRGADASVDFSGSSAGRKAAIDCVRPRGRIGWIGNGDPETSVPQYIIGRGLTLTGCWIFSIDTYDELARFLVDHRLSLEKMVTHRFPLESAPEAFRLFDTSKTGKIVFLR